MNNEKFMGDSIQVNLPAFTMRQLTLLLRIPI